MKLSQSKFAFIAVVVAGAAFAHGDSSAYAESGVFTTFSNAGADLVMAFSNSTYNDYYNENDPASFGTYTNSPLDSSSALTQLDPNVITASVQSTATGYSYTGWVNENETVYGIYNAGTQDESITVSSTCYAVGNDGISGSGGSALYSSVGAIVEDFSGQGNWTVFASELSTNFSTYGFEGTTAAGSTTIVVAPDQTLDFVAYDYEITQVNSNPVPEPFTVGLLGLSCVGLIAGRRSKLKAK